jgi:hypothetical protein
MEARAVVLATSKHLLRRRINTRFWNAIRDYTCRRGAKALSDLCQNQDRDLGAKLGAREERSWKQRRRERAARAAHWALTTCSRSYAPFAPETRRSVEATPRNSEALLFFLDDPVSWRFMPCKTRRSSTKSTIEDSDSRVSVLRFPEDAHV